MKQCWAEEPSERPSFVEVARVLKVVNKGRSVFLHSSDVLILSDTLDEIVRSAICGT